MKILIIRHAEPDYSIDSLTEKGKREAQLLKERLLKLDIRDFYCSPLGRAKDTAAPTLDALGRTAEICDWLREFDGRITDPKPVKNAAHGTGFRYRYTAMTITTTRANGLTPRFIKAET